MLDPKLPGGHIICNARIVELQESNERMRLRIIELLEQSLKQRETIKQQEELIEIMDGRLS